MDQRPELNPHSALRSLAWRCLLPHSRQTWARLQTRKEALDLRLDYAWPEDLQTLAVEVSALVQEGASSDLPPALRRLGMRRARQTIARYLLVPDAHRSLALRCLLPHSRGGWDLLHAEYLCLEALREAGDRPPTPLELATREVVLSRCSTLGLRAPDRRTARRNLRRVLRGLPALEETP